MIIFGLQIYRKVPVMLNYSSGETSLRHAMDIADIRLIITSRAFMERIKMDPAVFEGKKVDLSGRSARHGPFYG